MLSAYEYIISKQIQWAMNQGLDLIGSAGDRGRPAYTRELKQNLFSPLGRSARTSFDQGNGNEILSSSTMPNQATHNYL
jgi:hypothetical protein